MGPTKLQDSKRHSTMQWWAWQLLWGLPAGERGDAVGDAENSAALRSMSVEWIHRLSDVLKGCQRGLRK